MKSPIKTNNKNDTSLAEELKENKKDFLYIKKMSLIPAYIIGGLCIISLIVMMFINGNILPSWVVFIYIGCMFLMILSILYPGHSIASRMLKRKKEKNKNIEKLINK